MNDFTKEDLRIILSWGMDRADSVGLPEFVKDNHDVVYLKVKHRLEFEEKDKELKG
jgi:hypothetical protein